jgi:hypothetical protein
MTGLLNSTSKAEGSPRKIDKKQAHRVEARTGS